ncbi:hypothetical protein Hanom_Chr17g01530841 [Helianthus anomalus]
MMAWFGSDLKSRWCNDHSPLSLKLNGDVIFLKRLLKVISRADAYDNREISIDVKKRILIYRSIRYARSTPRYSTIQLI